MQGKLCDTKVKQSTASNKQTPKKLTIWTNSTSPPQVKNESPRKITPRFVTDEESGMQSLANPMVAFCRLGKRDVKVHIKWASK